MGSPVAGFSDSTRSPWVLSHTPSKAPGFSGSMPRESRILEMLLTVSTVIGFLLEGFTAGSEQDITALRGVPTTMPRHGRPHSVPAPRPVRRLVRDVRLGNVVGGERGGGALPARNPALDRCSLAGPSPPGRGGAPAAAGPLDRRGGELLVLAGAAGGLDGRPPPAGLLRAAGGGGALLAAGGRPTPGPAGAGAHGGRDLPVGPPGLGAPGVAAAVDAARPSQPARRLAGAPAAPRRTAGPRAGPLAVRGAGRRRARPVRRPGQPLADGLRGPGGRGAGGVRRAGAAPPAAPVVGRAPGAGPPGLPPPAPPDRGDRGRGGPVGAGAGRILDRGPGGLPGPASARLGTRRRGMDVRRLPGAGPEGESLGGDARRASFPARAARIRAGLHRAPARSRPDGAVLRPAVGRAGGGARPRAAGRRAAGSRRRRPRLARQRRGRRHGPAPGRRSRGRRGARGQRPGKGSPGLAGAFADLRGRRPARPFSPGTRALAL